MAPRRRTYRGARGARGIVSTRSGDAIAAAVVELLRRDDVRAALREAVAGDAPDEWLHAEAVRARYGLRMRAIVEAAGRGELEIGRAGRGDGHGGLGRPIVRRRELERWLVEHERSRAARRTSRETIASRMGTGGIYELAVARARRADAR